MKRIPASELQRIAVDALRAHGLQDPHGDTVARALVTTSLRGVDTHGIRLLEVYCRELEGGRSAQAPSMSFSQRFPAFGVLVARHAPGVVAGTAGMQHAIDIAREQGIAAVSITHSNHYGAAGYYAALAAEAGMIGISCSHSDALVAAFNGVDAMNGTNPLAMAAPGNGKDLFLLDMATSQVSFSRVTRYLLAGQPLEPGWVVDGEGRDAAERRDVHALQPLGGYKGQGLGMLVQVLSATLSGMPADHTITQTYGEPWDTHRNIGHLCLCLNIEAVSDTAAFRQRMTDLLEAFRRARSVGNERIIAPGDKEAACMAYRSAHGIPVTDAEYRFLREWIPSAIA